MKVQTKVRLERNYSAHVTIYPKNNLRQVVDPHMTTSAKRCRGRTQHSILGQESSITRIIAKAAGKRTFIDLQSPSTLLCGFLT